MFCFVWCVCVCLFFGVLCFVLLCWFLEVYGPCCAACWILGALDAKEALPKLEELLNDESSFVQYGAKDAIHRLKDE